MQPSYAHLSRLNHCMNRLKVGIFVGNPLCCPSRVENRTTFPMTHCLPQWGGERFPGIAEAVVKPPTTQQLSNQPTNQPINQPASQLDGLMLFVNAILRLVRTPTKAKLVSGANGNSGIRAALLSRSGPSMFGTMQRKLCWRGYQSHVKCEPLHVVCFCCIRAGRG